MKTNDTYIVYRQGVYMQGVVGVFDDYEVSKACAIEAIWAEKDDWHTMRVIRMPFNVNNAGKPEKLLFEVTRKGMQILKEETKC